MNHFIFNEKAEVHVQRIIWPTADIWFIVDDTHILELTGSVEAIRNETLLK